MAAKRKAGALLQHVLPKDNFTTDNMNETNDEEYSSHTKDAERLKFMMMAWNYQNQGRNGDLVDSGVLPAGLGAALSQSTESMAELWASYHNALGLVNKKTNQDTASPVHTVSVMDSGTNQDETSSSAGGNGKDDDDACNSDDDSDDRADTLTNDPERLKAFNMFVRLFVDENLDRIVPISKQPKEKIQAIIDSCTRQFPEFAERARKRIRTYLKSCRRNKKVRGEIPPTTVSGVGTGGGSNTWDSSSRPTPAHLTSAAAEHILAQACENESLNAKRMRLGLEPVTQSMPTIPPHMSVDTTASSSQNSSHLLSLYSTAQSLATSSVTNSIRDRSPIRSLQESNRGTVTPPTPPYINNNNIIKDNVNASNGSKTASPASSPAPLFKTNFTTSFNQTNNFNRGSLGAVNSTLTNNALLSTLSALPPTVGGVNAAAVAAYQTALLSAMASQALPLTAPTDLSTKSTTTTTSSNNTGIAALGSTQTTGHKLSPAEAAAVRQLVTGYRESAAFLLRSADELDALLHH